MSVEFKGFDEEGNALYSGTFEVSPEVAEALEGPDARKQFQDYLAYRFERALHAHRREVIRMMAGISPMPRRRVDKE